MVQCNGKKESDSLAELKEQYNMAYEDTAQVTKIVISDKSPARVELTRVQGGWVVGPQKHPVRKDAIQDLLHTIGSIKMRSFVQEKAIPAVLQRMDTYGKWVEVYAGEALVANYIVGTETPDMLGTYYKKVDSELPFAMHIQGFNGYTTTRFITEETLWYDRTVFGLTEAEIASVELFNPMRYSEGWKIQRAGGENASWEMIGGEMEPLEVSDPLNVHRAVASLKTLKYEGVIIPSDNIWSAKDSIFNATPAFEMTVVTTAGTQHKVQAFYKKPEGAITHRGDGTPYDFDPDRFYAKLDDGRMVLIQRYAWSHVLRTRFEF